jgi:hypothetical protein
MENLISSIAFTAIIFFPFTVCLFAEVVIRIDKYLSRRLAND